MYYIQMETNGCQHHVEEETEVKEEEKSLNNERLGFMNSFICQLYLLCNF